MLACMSEKAIDSGRSMLLTKFGESIAVIVNYVWKFYCLFDLVSSYECRRFASNCFITCCGLFINYLCRTNLSKTNYNKLIFSRYQIAIEDWK
jgi:hypothetical protein